jgi:hypothetical protein
MSTIVAQDDVRQELIAKHCGLINSTKRYGADAFDENNVEFEIKSGTTKNHISTARDFGFNILREYKKKYWIIASGTLHKNKTYLMEELYVAHPNNLNFFFDKVEGILQEKQRVIEDVKLKLEDLSETDKKIIDTIFNRGTTLNDPRISMKDIRIHCTKLDHKNSKLATEQVKSFIKKNPLSMQPVVQTFNHDFFVW